MLNAQNIHLKTTLATLLFMVFVQNLMAARITQDNTKSMVRQLFSEAKYTAVLPLVSDLLKSNPADPELNYFYGASLIETGQFSPEARRALEAAGKRNASARIAYYFGKIYQSEGNWGEALANYQKYRQTLNEREAQDQGIDELIQQCQAHQTPGIANTPESNSTIPATPDRETTALQTEIRTEPRDTESTAEPAIQEAESNPDTLIDFQVNAYVRYVQVSQFKYPESKEKFLEGVSKDRLLKQMVRNTDSLRKIYDSASLEQREKIASEILEAEQNTINLNREIPDLYMQARVKEDQYWQNASPELIEAFQKETQRLADSIKQAQIDWKRRHDELVLKEKQKDTIFIELPASPINPVSQDPKSGIVYKVQIGAYSGKLPDYVDRTFKKLAVLRKIETYKDEKGVTIYTTGNLKSYDEAVTLQKQVQQEGVKNAQIAAYKNGKRITLAEARQENIKP